MTKVIKNSCIFLRFDDFIIYAVLIFSLEILLFCLRKMLQNIERNKYFCINLKFIGCTSAEGFLRWHETSSINHVVLNTL